MAVRCARGATAMHGQIAKDTEISLGFVYLLRMAFVLGLCLIECDWQKRVEKWVSSRAWNRQ